jgi:hypothetical protein
MIEIQSPQLADSAFPRYMRRADAARYIRETYGIPCVAPTLAKYACKGGGPVFRKASKFPIYAREDLDAWAKNRLSKPVRSTSELSTPG